MMEHLLRMEGVIVAWFWEPMISLMDNKVRPLATIASFVVTLCAICDSFLAIPRPG